MAAPTLRLAPLDKTEQQLEKSPEKSPTTKIDDDTEFTQAIDQFTAAIELNRNNYTLYSNRSAAFIRLGRYAEALEDAKKTLELKPDWPKVISAAHYSNAHVYLINNVKWCLFRGLTLRTYSVCVLIQWNLS